MTALWDEIKAELEGCPATPPDEVIYWDVQSDGYEGSACLIYRIGTEYWTSESSHCSCNGNSFDPEGPYSRETLIAAIKLRTDTWRLSEGAKAEILKKLELNMTNSARIRLPEPKRWKVDVAYHPDGHGVIFELEELEELHDRIENGEPFNEIQSITITYQL